MRSNFSTEIAGVYYRRQKLESGRFKGFIQKDPNNPEDPEAVAVYLSNCVLVGYIPRTQQYYLKAWNPNFNNKNGEIFLNIEKEWDRYSGFISLETPEDYSEENPLRGKKIYICKDINSPWGNQYVSIGKSFGVNYNTQLKLDTDYVVYGDTVPQMVLDKQASGNYHFELLSIPDFIKMGLNPETCDSRIYGKTVYTRKQEADSYVRHIYSYILENGGILTDRFSKKCNVALKWNEEFAPTIKERIAKYDTSVVDVASILKRDPYISPLSVTQSTSSNKPAEKEVRITDKKQVDNNSVLFTVLLITAAIITLVVLIR